MLNYEGHAANYIYYTTGDFPPQHRLPAYRTSLPPCRHLIDLLLPPQWLDLPPSRTSRRVRISRHSQAESPICRRPRLRAPEARYTVGWRARAEPEASCWCSAGCVGCCLSSAWSSVELERLCRRWGGRRAKRKAGASGGSGWCSWSGGIGAKVEGGRSAGGSSRWLIEPEAGTEAAGSARGSRGSSCGRAKAATEAGLGWCA